MPLVHIGVGANLGDPPAQVEAAIAALTGIGRLVARSSLYRSAPWGESDQ
ncbi:MAG TPA: 2-amino-4-hydroxy-6-hydroxymethyldihydropteridine diphosphokinase, partial [Candidatus Dormibacteraeota bacterium]|nr:2-amino-4-hydroxy-6-hydroxymethyldihydropteridine diphosphokinase [Candidatus Dormibacteraeota bacterium]